MRTAVCLGILLIVALKFAAAGRFDLFGDEAFYWASSQRPAIGYVDHPPLTAMLVRLGTELVGHTVFGVRFAFLLIGVAVPFAMLALARELVDEREAWLAAGAAMLIPGTFHPGMVAVPDAPIVLFTILLLRSLLRAIDRGARADWMLAGLWAALGLATHYRFSVVLLSALVYLSATRVGRRHWRDPNLWSGAAVAAVGLVPALVYNLQNDFGPLRYHLAGRHGASFDFSKLGEYLVTQMAGANPIFFVAMVAAFADLVRRTRAGDGKAAVAACFAATPYLFYFAASPLEDTGLTTLHWPAPAFVPMLVFVPGVLIRFVRARPTWLRKGVVALGPALGLFVISVLLIELGTNTVKLSNARWNFYGWSEVGAEVRERLDEEPALVVADNYLLGTELMFELGPGVEVFVLDHPDNTFHGRAKQMEAWEIDEPSLRKRSGDPALFVVQVEQTHGADLPAWMEHVASFAAPFEPDGELKVESTWRKKRDGRWKFKLFRFYRGTLNGD